PPPRDAHDWIQSKHEAIADAARKAGIKLHGFRSAESFKNGIVHWHGQTYAKHDDIERLRGIMHRLLPDETTRQGGFSAKKKQSLVERSTTDPGEAAQWASYADKHGHGRKAQPGKEGGKVDGYETFTDEDMAFLW